MPSEFLSDTEREENEAEEETEDEAEGEAEEGERDRKWKRKAVALRSFMRENSPFAQDFEFLPILDDPKFRHGAITLETILALHKGVMEADGQNEAAGQPRTCNVSVGRHYAIDHTQVKAKMLTFVQWFNEMLESGQMGAGEIAARASIGCHARPAKDLQPTKSQSPAGEISTILSCGRRNGFNCALSTPRVTRCARSCISFLPIFSDLIFVFSQFFNISSFHVCDSSNK